MNKIINIECKVGRRKGVGFGLLATRLEQCPTLKKLQRYVTSAQSKPKQYLIFLNVIGSGCPVNSFVPLWSYIILLKLIEPHGDGFQAIAA